MRKASFEKGGDYSPRAERSSWWQSFRQVLPYLGPAFVVAVAYVDPGNVATNLAAGSGFAYDLLWVVLLSNIVAIFFQSLSAKLGVATGKNLPEICRQEYSPRLNLSLWIGAEIAAMATDLAEFLGAALGINLVFGIPLIEAALMTGIVTLFILSLHKFSFRWLEGIISVLIAVVSLGYVYELFASHPSWRAIAVHTLVPSLPHAAIVVAVGMFGATVMPHVIFLHSDLVQPRRKEDEDPRRHFRFEFYDILIAMNIAFVINGAMVAVAAATFFGHHLIITSIQQAAQTLGPLLGPLAAVSFGIALMASGISSSTVGTLAGQVIMQGFVDYHIPLWLRRLVTMVPSIVIIALGVNPISALILSQVVLSLALPLPIFPLMAFTGRQKIMGVLTNPPWVRTAGWILTGVIVALNATLIVSFL